MKLYSRSNNYKLYHGSMLDLTDIIPAESIGAVITDPPYELNFMSKGWDNAGISFQSSTWRKCYEVLKPGGYLLAFGGSRTFHRIACAIEDAGFEIRDTIMWLYGSGFPKSMNIGLAIDKKNGVESKVIGTKEKTESWKYKNNNVFVTDGELDKVEIDIKQASNEWQGWGTALKPAFEPIIIARKPFKGSLVDNVIKYGVGGINIDECRVGNKELHNSYAGNKNSGFTSADSRDDKGKGMFSGSKKGETVVSGRFPANIILTYEQITFDEVCGSMPNTKSVERNPTGNKILDPESGWNDNSMVDKTVRGFNDSGSACRYFYCAKASKKDRDEGLEEFELKGAKELLNREDNSDGASWNGKYSSGNAYAGAGCPKKNTHPTVKPTTLMQYLIRLVTPKGETILDPFNGSGSTGKAAMYENIERNADYKYIGIELTEEYLPIAKARIEYAEREAL